MLGEQRVEVDCDKLVAVQRVDVTLLLALPRGELDPAAAAEPFGLLGADDLGPEVAERLGEERALVGRARDDHAFDAGFGKTGDLVPDQRPIGDVDERLRAAAGGVTHPLGLSPGQDDRLH